MFKKSLVPLFCASLLSGSFDTQACRMVTKLVFIFAFLNGVFCLRLVSLQFPSQVTVGEAVVMSCSFDLEYDLLYSIKWYRDDVEFYRFVPRDKPPGQFFRLPSVRVNLVRSVNGTLYLEDTDEKTSGMYKCEVSADAPSFQTVSAQKQLHVGEYLMSSADRCGLRQPYLLAAALLTLAFLW